MSVLYRDKKGAVVTHEEVILPDGVVIPLAQVGDVEIKNPPIGKLTGGAAGAVIAAGLLTGGAALPCLLVGLAAGIPAVMGCRCSALLYRKGSREVLAKFAVATPDEIQKVIKGQLK